MLAAWPLLLLLQGAVAGVSPADQAPQPAVVEPLPRPQASVVLVRGHLGGIRVHQGSGVVVAPGLVATNAHVAQGAQGLTVQQGAAVWPVVQVRLDRQRDVCLLTVPGLTVPPADLAPEPTEPGQAVVAIGYPSGQGPVVSPGRLRGIWHYGEGRLLQSDASTLPGSSGGGLFDGEGRLLGLTTMTFTPSPRLNFSVPVAWIQELAQSAGDRPRLGIAEELGDGSATLMERLASDPRNWPAWEIAARQWVLDLPRDENAWLALGLALDRSARTSAESKAETMPGTLPEAVAAYRHSLTLQAKPKTWNNLGVALDLLNQFEEAERAFGQALAQAPDYALAWMNLGCARMNANHFAAAAEAFQRGLALRPDDGAAWERLAGCQRGLGQRDAAIGSLRIALRYRPLAAELWLDLGLLLVDRGHRDEALAVQNRLATLDPDRAERLRVALKPRVRSGRSRGGAAAERRGR